MIQRAGLVTARETGQNDHEEKVDDDMIDSAMKTFHLGDILSITTGKLVSLRHVEGVYDILGYMTGEPPFTHQLGRFMEECRPHLFRQHPMLASVTGDEVTQDNWRQWLDEQIAHYGEMLEIASIPQDDHTRRDPIEELRQIAPHAEIIPIIVDEKGPLNSSGPGR